MTGPCADYLWVAHLVMAVFGGLTSMLTVWLAHRRWKADRERKWFYRQMRLKHGLSDGKEFLKAAYGSKRQE